MHERIHKGCCTAPVPDRKRAFARVADVAAALLLIAVLMPAFVGVAILSYRPNMPLIQRRQRSLPRGRRVTVFEFNAGARRAPAGNRAARGDGAIPMYLRMIRGDQLPQLFNVVRGELSFFGDASRPRLFAD